MINYAHRGASSYAPENTKASFDLGLEMKADGIETDVRSTRDGVLVLFHDDSLKRVTGADGAVEDFAYDELLKLDCGQGQHIMRFKDFLDLYGHKGLELAIELKGKGVGLRTMRMLRDEGIEHFTVTSFMYDQLLEVRYAFEDVRLGYLTSAVTKETVDMIVSDGLAEFCPQAGPLTPELCSYAHSKGLTVRAWGVADEILMMHCIECGVDGMTVNFPDVLRKVLIGKKKEK